MQLTSIDWLLIGIFFTIFIIIGWRVAKRSGSNTKEFFLSGQDMPWWLLGISMVATTFSADTPNLVTDIVRQNGVSGNWVWWAFLLTGMLTVFVYARLWRRSEVLTDLAFYEMRYSGKAAAFLRGFRAIYLGVFFNVMIMAAVCLAAIKIGGVLFDLKPWQSVIYASIVTVIYSSLGGLRGVIFTDFLQFIVAMVGSIWAAYYIIQMPQIGGLNALLNHAEVVNKLNFLPDFDNRDTLWTLLLIPLAVQWWSVWYPGAEPGGGGYIAQRMLSAKNEHHAVGATLLFNITHYALRPWPWILIALASLILYPELSDIKAAFPNTTEGHDLGYSAMLTHLPPGLLGLVVSSLIAAFMSTISTHLNWGSSYIALDFYKRFVHPTASEMTLVWVGRLSTVILMVLSGLLALQFESALDTFNILLQIGAGTGLIFILRWFWWRINAYSEISGMLVSFLIALFFEFSDLGIDSTEKLLLGVGITTVSWVIVTLLTRPTEEETLRAFYNKIRPYGSGWNGFKQIMKKKNIHLNESNERFSSDLLLFLLGVVVIYSALFGTGYLLYGENLGAIVFFSILLLSAWSMRNIVRSRLRKTK